MESGNQAPYRDGGNQVVQQQVEASWETTSAPIQMLVAYSQQRANTNDVMRSLVSHRNWFAPLTSFAKSGAEIRRVDSALILSTQAHITPDELWIFTNPEAAFRAQAAGALLGTYAGGMTGKKLFRDFPPATKVVRVNPYSPLEHTWTLRDGGGIEAGKIWADAIALEDSFEQWQQNDKSDKTAFLNYRAFLTFDNSFGRVVTLPNQFGMSNPAAAFTAPDCADMFLSELAEDQRAGLQRVTIAGHTLFEKSPVLGIDGLIVNVFGPGATHALIFETIGSES